VKNSIKEAIKEMMQIIGKKVPNAHRKAPVNLYIAGGIAIYYYTATRVSKDVDAIIDHNINIPKNLSVLWINEDGTIEELIYDHQYTSTLGIMHEDYESRAYLQYTIDRKLKVHILSPEDLVISKLARFGEQDQEDIKSLIQNDLVDKENLEKWTHEAMISAVGIREKSLQIHLNLALEMFDQ
jgi:hypothetical protein